MHITESCASIQKIFSIIVDFSINFMISFGMCSRPKLSKEETLLFHAYKAILWVPLSEYSSRFITYAPSFSILHMLH